MEHGDIEWKMEAQAIFLIRLPFAHRAKRKFVICLFVDEGTNESCPFAKGLNGLTHLCRGTGEFFLCCLTKSVACAGVKHWLLHPWYQASPSLYCSFWYQVLPVLGSALVAYSWHQVNPPLLFLLVWYQVLPVLGPALVGSTMILGESFLFSLFWYQVLPGRFCVWFLKYQAC
jgi:hypothetical protein